MSSRDPLIVFLGPKDSGKSSLIKAVFPELDVIESEPTYFRNYRYESFTIREVSGRMEVVDFLRSASVLWDIDTAIIVADASNLDSLREAYRMSPLVANSRRKALVLNKIDQAAEGAVKEGRKYAERLGCEYFPASCRTGEGISSLSSWIRGVKVVAPPKPRREIIPIPGAGIPKLDERLYTDYELKVLMPGKDLDDLDRRILSLVDGERTAREIADTIGLTYHEMLARLRRLRAKGYIKDIKHRIL